MPHAVRLVAAALVALTAFPAASALIDAGIVTDHAPCVATVEPVLVGSPYSCQVPTGDFECGRCGRFGGFPPNWHRSGPDHAGVAWTDEASHFLGRGSIRFDDRVGLATSVSSDLFDMDGSGTYVASLWHKGVPDRFGEETVVHVYVLFYGYSDWPIAFARGSATVGEEWTQLNVVATAPASADRASFLVRTTWDTSGSFYVDDAALAKPAV